MALVIFISILKPFRQWRDRKLAHEALRGLDGRTWNDIGVSRHEIEALALARRSR